MPNDILGDILTRIRNSLLANNYEVRIPSTKLTKSLSKIFYSTVFIENISDFSSDTTINKQGYFFLRLKYIKNGTSVITNIKRVSRPSLRVYRNSNKIPRILGGSGLVIISTSYGLIPDQEARSRKLGGEILCYIWLPDVVFGY